MRLIVSLATALIIALSSNIGYAQAVDSVKTVTLTIANLHCNGDMPTIKRRLLNQEGIDEVAFTERVGETSTFTIIYHTSATNQTGIEKAIETTPGCDDKSETPYRVKKERPSKKKGS